jgi:hypothetical protein
MSESMSLGAFTLGEQPRLSIDPRLWLSRDHHELGITSQVLDADAYSLAFRAYEAIRTKLKTAERWIEVVRIQYQLKAVGIDIVCGVVVTHPLTGKKSRFDAAGPVKWEKQRGNYEPMTNLDGTFEGVASILADCVERLVEESRKEWSARKRDELEAFHTAFDHLSRDLV